MSVIPEKPSSSETRVDSHGAICQQEMAEHRQTSTEMTHHSYEHITAASIWIK